MVGRMQSNPQRRQPFAQEAAPSESDSQPRSCMAFRFGRKSSASVNSAERRRKKGSERISASSSEDDDEKNLLANNIQRNGSKKQSPWELSSNTTAAYHAQQQQQQQPLQPPGKTPTRITQNESPTSAMDPRLNGAGYESNNQSHGSVITNSPVVSPSTASNFESLLVPPTPVNRSPQLRHTRPRKGLYDGEAEPEGVRGQEAKVTPNHKLPPLPPGAPVMRTSFQPPTTPNTAFQTPQPQRPVAAQLPQTPSSVQQPQMTRVQLQRKQQHQRQQQARQQHYQRQQQARQQQQQSSSQRQPQSKLQYQKQPQMKQQQMQQHQPSQQPLPQPHQGSSPTGLYGYPSAQRPSEDDASREGSLPATDHQGRSLPAIQEQAPLQFSPETGQVVRWEGGTADLGLQQERSNSANEIRAAFQNRTHSDAESTASDDDIRYMMSDLMPSFSVSEDPAPSLTALSTPINPLTAGVQGVHKSQASVVSPNGLSRAAQKAAAAAAAVTTRVPNTIHEKVSMDSHEKRLEMNEDLEKLNTKAMEHVQQGEYDRALTAFSEVLQIHKRNHGDIHPAVASAHHNLGTVHAKRASLLAEDSRPQRHCRSQALECFQAAARSARDSLGKNHPNVAVSLVRIGFLLLQSRQYRNAVVTFEEALRIRVAHYGPKHGLVANLYNNLGVCFMHLEDFMQGKGKLEQALEIQRRIVQEQSNDRWVHMLELADTLFNVGGLCLEWIRRKGPHPTRSQDAVYAFQETLDIRSKVLGPDDPAVSQVRSLLEMARSIPTTQLASTTEVAEEPEPQLSRRDGQINNIIPRQTEAAVGTKEKQTMKSPELNSANSIALQRSTESPVDEQSRDGSRQDIFRSTTQEHSNESASRFLYGSEDASSTDDSAIGGPQQQRIRMKPHFVPQTTKGNHLNDSSNNATGEASYQEGFSLDRSLDAKKEMSYDDEESFMLQNTGVDSEHGRVHFPITWQKAGITSEGPKGKAQNGPDILVSAPYRSASPLNTDGDYSSADRSWSKMRNGVRQGSKYGERDLSPDRGSTISTGNRERDDVMSRARAILSAHPFPGRSSPDPPSGQNGTRSSDPTHQGLERVATSKSEEDFGMMDKAGLDQDLVEDGIAPLGGTWPSHFEETGESISLRAMMADPMHNLPDLHSEASRLLKNNSPTDAWKMFDIILQCQRKKHGPLHPGVASALHNVGIAQLRADSHSDALSSFEEAARVRKGSLGAEHPMVAVSLVKVGICLLLLHRFDQALWSFREALSIRKRALGPLHPSTARIYNNIGCVHVEFNEFKDARRAFEAALDVQRNALCHDPESGPLMFGTATTLCNLGYLYRFRDMHAKACLVLKEAVDLQESVLGRAHATVLSTLDNLADSFANSSNAVDALRTYDMILDRFRTGTRSEESKMARAEAVLLYKISRVHRQQNDRQGQLQSLKLAQRAMMSSNGNGRKRKGDSLERRIQYDIRACEEQLEKSQLAWV